MSGLTREIRHVCWLLESSKAPHDRLNAAIILAINQRLASCGFCNSAPVTDQATRRQERMQALCARQLQMDSCTHAIRRPLFFGCRALVLHKTIPRSPTPWLHKVCTPPRPGPVSAGETVTFSGTNRHSGTKHQDERPKHSGQIGTRRTLN